MATPSVNAQLRDLNVGHQVGLVRYANGLVRQVLGLLNRSDADLLGQLTTALHSFDAASFTVQRLDMLLQSVRALNGRIYTSVREATTRGLRDLTLHELGFQSELLMRVPPIRLPLAPVVPDQVFAAVLARPFQGRLLSEWSEGIETARMTRVRDAVRIGVVQQETIDQTVARLRGTRARGYSDGLLEIDRRSAESVVRTAVSHTAAVARNQLYGANADIMKAVQWLSTLDDRTTPICAVRDGLRYTCDTHKPIGHSVPWLGGPGAAHWGCRSSSTPVLKSMAELGLDVPELPPGQRSAMDGAVPEGTTYGEWFARQSAARQDEIVGPVRGRLFRQGGLTFEKFSNDKGKWLTLEQLRASDAEAFEKAGV